MTIHDLTHTQGYQRPPLAARLATYAAGALAGGIATAAVFLGTMWVLI